MVMGRAQLPVTYIGMMNGGPLHGQLTPIYHRGEVYACAKRYRLKTGDRDDRCVPTILRLSHYLVRWAGEPRAGRTAVLPVIVDGHIQLDWTGWYWE